MGWISATPLTTQSACADCRRVRGPGSAEATGKMIGVTKVAPATLARPGAVADHDRSVIDMPETTCKHTGCSERTIARGLCRHHYNQARARGEFSVDLRFGRKQFARCSVDGCNRDVRGGGRGLCSMHFQRLRKRGNVGPAGTLRSGRGVDSRGYVRVWNPQHPAAQADGYVWEHRMVWWDAHGPIPDGWQVHHVNGVKDDNRLENLQAMSNDDHQALHAAEAELIVNQFGVWPRRQRRVKVYDRPCSHCGGLISNSMRADAVYCSKTCNNRARKKRERLVALGGRDD